MGGWTRSGSIVVAVAAIAMALASPVSAKPLSFTFLPAPDITSSFVLVTYNASTDHFVAEGCALSIYDGSNSHNITGGPNCGSAGDFKIDATIDGGGAVVSGTLAIKGNVLSAGPVLLTGTLSAFGYNNSGGDLFQFMFDVTGGGLATTGLYGLPGGGNVVGVLLDAMGSNFNGSFASDWDNWGGFGLGVTDTAPIPEPASFALLAASLLVLGRPRRRQRQIG